MVVEIKDKVCPDCSHACHCDIIVCYKPIGVGMSDKWQPCACPICNCSKKEK